MEKTRNIHCYSRWGHDIVRIFLFCLCTFLSNSNLFLAIANYYTDIFVGQFIMIKASNFWMRTVSSKLITLCRDSELFFSLIAAFWALLVSSSYKCAVLKLWRTELWSMVPLFSEKGCLSPKVFSLTSSLFFCCCCFLPYSTSLPSTDSITSPHLPRWPL